MERIVRGRSATLSRTFTFTPTGTPTVEVTRSDGTAVTVGSASGPGTTWSYTIPASSNLLLDTYTETWTATTGGQDQTFTDIIEVAGGVLFTLAEARALKPLDQAVYTDERIIETRTAVEQAIEDACGVAFVPRYALETINGTGSTSLLLRPRVTAIRTASVGTSTVTDLTVDDLAGLSIGDGGTIDGYSWTAGIGNVTIGYEHGYTVTPAEIRRAALQLCKMWLTGENRPIDDRALTFSAENGASYSLAVPGRNGSIFGHPDIDSVVQRYSMVTGIA